MEDIEKAIADARTRLEQLIDAFGLADVTGLLVEICADKANYVRANYQDKANANMWENAGNALDKATDKLVKIFS